ncbi:MAG: DNA replication/repair protein RecF [Acidimicrobiales bacterium]|jgi:DNA replication and repair protein RecF
MDETEIVRLELHDFRNIESIELRPSLDGLTVVQGENGAGKTSLLEAVVYCSTLQSFRGAPREAVVRQGCAEAKLRCDVLAGTRKVEIEINVLPGRRDRAWHNAQRVPGTRGLLEVLRTTLFTPDDLGLVKGSPSGRRDFLDDVLAKSHPRLGTDRAALERVLRHRNALLRQLAGRLDSEAATTLDVWDDRLSLIGERLATSRAELVEALLPHAAEAFAVLAGGAGIFNMRYVRSWEGPLGDAIAASRREDLRRATTTVGPQRDELELEAGGLDARTRLSQGRQRCVALALRLASHRLMTTITGAAPVLLLDDAFSELDDATARALVGELPLGQALLTTAGELPPGASPKLVVKLANGRLKQ